MQRANAGQWVGVVLGTAAAIGAAVVATCIFIQWGSRRWRNRRVDAAAGGGGGNGGGGGGGSELPPRNPQAKVDRLQSKVGKQREVAEAEALRQLYGRKLVRSPPVGGANNAPLAWSCNPLALEEGGHGGDGSDDAALPPLPAWRPLQQGSRALQP